MIKHALLLGIKVAEASDRNDNIVLKLYHKFVKNTISFFNIYKNNTKKSKNITHGDSAKSAILKLAFNPTSRVSDQKTEEERTMKKERQLDASGKPKFGMTDKLAYAAGDLGCNMSFSLKGPFPAS